MVIPGVFEILGVNDGLCVTEILGVLVDVGVIDIVGVGVILVEGVIAGTVPVSSQQHPVSSSHIL